MTDSSLGSTFKADRAGRRLLVLGAYGESDIDEEAGAEALREELSTMAAWLGLDHGVSVADQGDLAEVLR